MKILFNDFKSNVDQMQLTLEAILGCNGISLGIRNKKTLIEIEIGNDKIPELIKTLTFIHAFIKENNNETD